MPTLPLDPHRLLDEVASDLEAVSHEASVLFGLMCSVPTSSTVPAMPWNGSRPPTRSGSSRNTSGVTSIKHVV